MPRKTPKVSIKWFKRALGPYAILRWTPKGGKRQSRSLGYVTAEEAESERLDQVAALRLGLRLETDSVARVVVVDVLLAYCDDLTTRHGGKKYHLAEVNRCELLADAIGHMRPERVSIATLRRYMQTRHREVGKRSGNPIKRSTILAELRTLRRAFRFSNDAGLIECSPPALPSKKDLPDDARPPRRLLEGEVRQILAAADEDKRDGFGSLVQMLAWSGRRPVAVFDMRVRDCSRLESDLAYFDRDKGGESRGWGPLTAPAKDALERRVLELSDTEPDQLLWPRDCGKVYCTESIRQPWQRVRDRTGLQDVNVYDLRKFAATRIYRVTGCIRTTMQFTGHRSPKTLLDHYIYAEQGAAELAAPRIGWTPAALTVVQEVE